MNRYFQALMPIENFAEWRKNHPVRDYSTAFSQLSDELRGEPFMSREYIANRMEDLALELSIYGVPSKDEKDLEYKTVRQIAVTALIVGFLIGMIGVMIVL